MGRFKFDWSADGVRSQGDLSLEDLTFRGPGLAVTQTAGINGDIRLTSLMPPTTDGVQRLRIDRIDLDALQLVEGAVDFALDGDDVLRIENASFPWFGGRIGVYDTEVAMKDGSATAVLRADEANLDEILEFVDVAGLSGEGVLDGVLPLVVEDGRARIDGGALSAVGPGVVRYVGAAAVAAASASADAALAFDGLQEFRYASLSATVAGPLDGDLKIGLEFEGEGAVRLNDPRLREATVLPMIYRVSVAGPLLQLVQQSKRTKNLILKLEGAVSSDEDGGP
ncbi:MAG: YdbH domain-containing protein [Parvularculaceae bacterium]